MNGLHDQSDDALLWRVNQQEFSVRLRSAACVAYIRNRHDPVAAAVVAALLEQPQGTDHAPCQVCSTRCSPATSAPPWCVCRHCTDIPDQA